MEYELPPLPVIPNPAIELSTFSVAFALDTNHLEFPDFRLGYEDTLKLQLFITQHIEQMRESRLEYLRTTPPYDFQLERLF